MFRFHVFTSATYTPETSTLYQAPHEGLLAGNLLVILFRELEILNKRRTVGNEMKKHKIKQIKQVPMHNLQNIIEQLFAISTYTKYHMYDIQYKTKTILFSEIKTKLTQKILVARHCRLFCM